MDALYGKNPPEICADKDVITDGPIASLDGSLWTYKLIVHEQDTYLSFRSVDEIPGQPELHYYMTANLTKIISDFQFESDANPESFAKMKKDVWYPSYD